MVSEIEIIKMVKEGKSYRQIQNETAVDKSKISRIMKKYNEGKIKLPETSETKTETLKKSIESEAAPIQKPRSKKKAVKLPNYIEFIEYCEKNKQKHSELYAKFYKNRKKWKSLIQDFLTVVGNILEDQT